MSLSESLIDRLHRHADEQPQREALVSRTETVSYAELKSRVVEAAAHLGRAGVSTRSTVGIHSENDSDHLTLCLAASALGASSITLPTFDTDGVREQLIKRIEATHVATGASSVKAISGGKDKTAQRATKPKIYFSTSGTTGEPKIVCHTDVSLTSQAHRHVHADERFACLATVQHNFAKRHRLYCLAEGATNVLIEHPSEGLVNELRHHSATTLHVTAFQAQELLALEDRHRLSGLRLKLGGSHVAAALRERLRAEVSAKLECGYGTTETGAIAFTDPNDPGAGESVGRLLTGMEARTLAHNGSTLPTGESGEIAIRASGMFLGYLGDPERTCDRLRGDWFHTGDVGRLDADGRLHLSGRVDDMFVFNSINIFPQELEAQIREHPQVTDVAVVAQASAVHGDVPVALIVPTDAASFSAKELKSFARERVGVRCPRRFHVVASIPRNDSGKILRDEARRMAAATTRDQA